MSIFYISLYFYYLSIWYKLIGYKLKGLSANFHLTICFEYLFNLDIIINSNFAALLLIWISILHPTLVIWTLVPRFNTISCYIPIGRCTFKLYLLSRWLKWKPTACFAQPAWKRITAADILFTAFTLIKSKYGIIN